jgi:hypothetical protein
LQGVGDVTKKACLHCESIFSRPSDSHTHRYLSAFLFASPKRNARKEKGDTKTEGVSDSSSTTLKKTEKLLA